MKYVCLLVQNYYDLDIRVRRKAEALAAAGFCVDVLGLRGSGKTKRYSLNGVNVETISLGKRRGGLPRYAFEYAVFLLWCLWRLTLRMPRRRYAVIDVNTLPDFLVFAALTARWMGAKVVLDMHEITPEFYMSKYGIAENSWLIRLLKWQERISFGFADHVLTINEPIQELLEARGLPGGKTTVITNSAEETRFASRTSSCPAADAAAASADFVMMYHGTLTRLYGLDLAIEAFALAHHSMPGAQLWILGDGPEVPGLKLLAEQRGMTSKVKLMGLVPPSEVPSWLSKCHVGVLPIRSDVFLEFASPNKLAELIVNGTPVIISRLRAVQHYFSQEALAYFQPNEPASLAEQMSRLYRDEGLRRGLAAAARKEYAPICWEVMRDRYLRLVEQMAEVHADRAPINAAAASR